jgi:hypothetical protein
MRTNPIRQCLVLNVAMLTAITRLHAADASLMTIPVNSPAFVFSPGNWTGDAGRAGKIFRQTWNPGAYYSVELKDAVDARKKARPADAKIAIIDLGPEVAKNLEVPNGLMGGLHPNDRGHANFAAAIIPQMVKLIEKERSISQ